MRMWLALLAGVTASFSFTDASAATATPAATLSRVLACSGGPWLKGTQVTFSEPGKATLHAVINPCATETAYQFDWAGPPGETEHEAPSSPQSIGSGMDDVAVEQTISVAPGFSYLYRVAIYTEGSIFHSEQHEFIAPPRLYCHCPRATLHCVHHGRRRHRGCRYLAFDRGVRAVRLLAAELCVKRCTSWKVQTCRRLTTQKIGCRFVAKLPEEETCTARIYAFLLEGKRGEMTLATTATITHRTCPADLGATP